VHARFYAPDADGPGALVDLPEDEAAHLTRVLRLQAGDRVRVFNGRGAEFEATVERATRGEVAVRTGPAHAAAPEARVAITFVPAVLKGDKMDDVVRDAVMLGVTAIQPLLTARTEVAAASLSRAQRVERWRRIAIASAKQSGRAVVPDVRQPITVDEVLSAISALTLPVPAVLLCEPGAVADAVRLSDLDGSRPLEASVIVGPEGGWTPEEIARAAVACRPVVLGGRTLRADAVPIVALAALFAVWKEF
jgi:16S rRNA (uracil1498-N3)-methyltransferase